MPVDDERADCGSCDGSQAKREGKPLSTRAEMAMAKVNAAIAEVFDDGEYHQAKETLLDCLGAVYSKRTGRDDTGKLIHEMVPDYPIRLAAAVKIIEWKIGKPIARMITADVSPQKGQQDVGADLFTLLMASPDAAAEILVKIQDAARKAKPIEIGPASESGSEAPPR